MLTNRSARGSLAAAAVCALVGFAAPLAAQHGHASHDMAMPESGFRAELIKDIDALEAKYVGLAEAFSADQYAWRPAEGVRSTGEVFKHIADANFMFPTMVGAEREQVATSDMKADGMDGLKHSFRHARHSIAGVSEAELDEQVKMFGRDATKRQVLYLMVTHMHEHLGQLIAYARTNGVTPPWSQGD